MENIFNLINLIAAITSIVLGIISIVLSLYFYRRSKEESQESYKLSKNIEGNVGKLDVIFDKMYSGTFSMMKDSYEKMSRHVYQNQENSQKVSKEIEAENQKIIEEIAEEVNDSDLGESELINKLNKMLKSAKEAEKKIVSKNIREKIMSYLIAIKKCTFKELETYLIQEYSDFQFVSLFAELEKMVAENLIYDPFEEIYNPSTGENEKGISHVAEIRLKKV